MLCLVKTVAQAGDGVPRRFIRVFAKTERQDEVPLRFGKINLGRQRHIAVLSPRVFPSHLFVRLQVLPAIGRTDVADRPLRSTERSKPAPMQSPFRCANSSGVPSNSSTQAVLPPP